MPRVSTYLELASLIIDVYTPEFEEDVHQRDEAVIV
jgi:hypothetical protein